MNQPLTDATSVWRTGRIEPPLNAFVGKFDGDGVLSSIFFVAPFPRQQT